MATSRVKGTKMKMTDKERCAYLHMLDDRFDTPVESPLHHDNKCPIHKEKSDNG
jgi:hypothetical protein